MKQKSSLLPLSTLTSLLLPVLNAHGATSFPPSRQWQCSGGSTPNLGVAWNGRNGAAVCQPSAHSGNINNVITNWSGVNANPGGFQDTVEYQQDPKSPHVAVMGGEDAPICSAAKASFDALDEVVWTQEWPDQVYPVYLESGAQMFEYKASAPHATYGRGYFDFYITKDDWDSENELTWTSLEDAPFCRYLGESDRNMQNTEVFPCTVPAKIGKHVIYSVWQRNDSPEAFYSCSDVIFEGEITSSPETADVTTTVLPPPTTTTTEPTSSSPETTESSTTSSPILTTTTPSSKFTLFHENHIKQATKCVTKSMGSTHLTTTSCGRDDSAQQFFAHNGRQIRSGLENNECWQVVSSRGRRFLNVVTCEDFLPEQMFQYDSETGYLHPSENRDYCVASGSGDNGDLHGDLVVLPCGGVVESFQEVGWNFAFGTRI